MANRAPVGCLGFLLRLFGVRLDSSASESDIELPYQVREDFISAAELSFYHALKLAIRDQSTIFTKVNLADVFYAIGEGSKSYRNRIAQKHVDFLLCEPKTLKPQCGVELDDKSHSRRDRQDRDHFVDAVFRAAGLPLVRIPATATYNPAELATQLLVHCRPLPAAVPSPPAFTPSATSPMCQKCNLPMVRKVATKGQHAGKQFWACPNFPKCRSIAS
ncbi:MAG: DUF2726 domain-containing protein [Pirellulales bacterium]